MPRVPFTIDNRFLEEVRDSVLAHARSYCGSWATTDDCEDLVQEAMLAMYKNVRSGRLTVLTSRLSTYVNGILENIAKKQFRERQKIADRCQMLAMVMIFPLWILPLRAMPLIDGMMRMRSSSNCKMP